jgi:hypothetical protein
MQIDTLPPWIVIAEDDASSDFSVQWRPCHRSGSCIGWLANLNLLSFFPVSQSSRPAKPDRLRRWAEYLERSSLAGEVAPQDAAFDIGDFGHAASVVFGG